MDDHFKLKHHESRVCLQIYIYICYWLTLHWQLCGLAYSPDGDYLATASEDYSVAIWDVATGKRKLNGLSGNEQYGSVVYWSPDSKKILIGAWDNTIRVFDVETGTMVYKPLIGHTRIPIMLAIHSSPHHDLKIVSGKHAVCLTCAVLS